MAVSLRRICARFDVRPVLRHRKLEAVVVLPEEVHVDEGPFVRPAHTAWTTSHEVDLTPLLDKHLVRPRDGEEPVPQHRA